MKCFALFISLLLLFSSHFLAAMSVDCGVSLELANHRKASIVDLRYNIFFSIPALRNDSVYSEETVTFRLRTTEDVVFDFCADTSLIRSVFVNGRKCLCRFENEHIVVPSFALRKGRNSVTFHFVAGNQSLNRRDDLLYTLFVPDRARTVFPCMDQPDLKAHFTLSLELPAEWTAVSNSAAVDTLCFGNGRKRISFAETEPLPTYLFAFTVGRLFFHPYSEDGCSIGIYHRETDSDHLSQLDSIGHEVVYSLRWLERYTDMPYPFSKYDLIILPGFQFGGMEHTGATFYNDTRMFLSANPTTDERMARLKLITHETAHMWFGDVVTMQWFNDVWIKEVFANLFAAWMTTPLFPETDHQLNILRAEVIPSMSEDRTQGATPIRQPLDNLCNAGLVYNNIIYFKAPLMMDNMVEFMGHEAFHRGICKYLRKFKYSNATWDDFVAVMDSETDCDILQFSDNWVNHAGMPVYKCNADTDSAGHLLLPNADGRGYGYFTMSDGMLVVLADSLLHTANRTARLSFLITLNENWLNRRVDTDFYLQTLLTLLCGEQNPMIASAIIDFMHEPLMTVVAGHFESQLVALVDSHSLPSVRTGLIRLLASVGRDKLTVKYLYRLWSETGNPLLSERDYMTLALELSVRLPELGQTILDTEAVRLSNPDRQREFAFLSPSVSPLQSVRDSLFRSLLIAENRRIEPWASRALYYLNHPLRASESVGYIRPALEILPDIQHTGDIFFPSDWCKNLLAGHRSKEAYNEVLNFLESHPDMLSLLRNKILVPFYYLSRLNQ